MSFTDDMLVFLSGSLQLLSLARPETAQCALPFSPPALPGGETAQGRVPRSAAHPEIAPWSSPESKQSSPGPDRYALLRVAIRNARTQPCRTDPRPPESD